MRSTSDPVGPASGRGRPKTNQPARIWPTKSHREEPPCVSAASIPPASAWSRATLSWTSAPRWVGLRSLAPGHPDYKSHYDGDLRARDAAYHQGTVWGWLAGPFADAWLKVHPNDRDAIAHLIDGFAEHLGEACIGSISEIFDAQEPFTPRGCVVQAWSVAEVLRILVKCRHLQR